MTASLIQQTLVFAQGKNPYIVRHDSENPDFSSKKNGHQDFIEHRWYAPADQDYLTSMQKIYPVLITKSLYSRTFKVCLRF